MKDCGRQRSRDGRLPNPSPGSYPMRRRSFIRLAVMAAMTTAPASSGQASTRTTGQRYLRPPGALPESDFVRRCIHCGQCGEVCPNRCINYFGLENGLASLDTPYITPREKACILCMKCGEVCPSGAIQPIPRTISGITKGVRMGRAQVDKRLCLSYQGKTCGVCYRACPLPDLALRVGMLEQPEVSDACVGCGLCERSCIQMPQAIRVIPDQA